MPFIVSKAISPEGSIPRRVATNGNVYRNVQEGSLANERDRFPQVDFSILVRGCRGKIVLGVASDARTHSVREVLHQGGDTCVQSWNGVADFSAAWNCFSSASAVSQTNIPACASARQAVFCARLRLSRARCCWR